jgi:hypothetical protein
LAVKAFIHVRRNSHRNARMPALLHPREPSMIPASSRTREVPQITVWIIRAVKNQTKRIAPQD